MKSYVVQVFRKTSQSVLRFFDDPTAARPLPAERPLPPEPIEAFAHEVDSNYKKRAPNLADIGNRLYGWLDGPTERWLERILAEPATLHLDVDERLRHLPWELLCRDGAFLCANHLRPFTPVRRIAPATTLPLFTPAPPPANRPLRILFMASSPNDVAPVLDFEKEESLILEATQRHQIELIVEESGTLDGLRQRIEEHSPSYYDVFHLTGHADVCDGKPCFVLETEIGQACFISADDLARTFSNAWPRLVFLSGCKPGQAVDQGQLPSLCEALIYAGAPAVLGWALPVSDHAASLAAKEIYDRLAAGKSIDEAVAYAKAAVIGHIAGVVNARNDFDKAFEMWHKSIALSEQIGDVKGKAATLSCVVAALYERGRLAEALKLVDEVFELCEEGESRRYKAAILNSKAAILMSQGEVTRAADLWDEALKIQQDIGDAEGEAQTLYNMAYVPAERGEFDKALELWGKASGLKGKIGDVRGQAKAIRNMALYDQSGKALELLGEAFALEMRVDASRSMMSTKLKSLKIEQYRYLAPGTHLVFNDIFNVLLGQNGTGKTTLLDLITRIVTGDFSSLKGEAFAIEYALSYPGLTITAALRNDTATWSSTLSVQIEGLPAAYTIAATPFGTAREISDQPGSSTPILLTTPFDPGHLAGALFKVAEVVEPAHQKPLFAAAVLSAQIAETLFRFDEALGGFQLMTGTPPAERASHALSARFEFSKNHRLAPGLRAFLPAQLWSRLTALMPELLAAKGGRLPHTEVDFLKKAVDIMHFKEAEMSLRLQKKDVNAGVERLIYGDFEFLFTLRDGSIINQNDLSYGQKRLLAFFYYVAANEHILVADELVNGLHHEWIETCRDEIEGRQSFLTSQNPLLLDFLFFSSTEEVRKSFILCRQEDRDGRSTMVAENLSEDEAEAFYRAYQTEVQHVSEILRTKGLW